MIRLRHNESGYTLVMLLVFVSMAMMISTSAAMMSAINTRSNTSVVNGNQALSTAEAGVHLAMQNVLRNNTYTGGTVTMPNGTATITVSGTTTRTITSVGVTGNFRRTLTVVATLTGNVWAITSWNETP